MKRILVLALMAMLGFRAAWSADVEKYTIETDASIVTNGFGIMFSAIDGYNYLYWEFLAGSDGTCSIKHHFCINGSDSTAAEVSESFATTGVMKVKIDVDGTVAKTYVNGTLVDTYTDALGLLRYGLMGFGIDYASVKTRQQAWFDNAKVTIHNNSADSVALDENFENAGATGFQLSDTSRVREISGSKVLYLRTSLNNPVRIVEKWEDSALNAESVACDPMADTWVTDDELGRTVGTSDDGLSTSPDGSQIGMFYYILHGQHGEEFKDITKILNEDPDNPAWGEENQIHWGGKPALGYYKGGTPYIIAKHIQMLVDAGVDFLFFDISNGFTYDDNVKAVISEIDRRAALGLKYPRLVFCCWAYTKNVVQHLYDTWYSKPEYDKYWYYWKGRPLLFCNKDEFDQLPNIIKWHFTQRTCWAWQAGDNRWPWEAFYPQGLGTVEEFGRTVEEQISVTTAQHATIKVGKSYHDGKEPDYDKYGLCKETPQGLCFAEQWKQAFAKHPPLVMITQWNEWVAQRFVIKDSTHFGDVRPGATAKIGESYFVDVYNQEFSRDIEPSKEPLIRDNYYMQLIDNVRRYRGVRPIPEPTVAKTIDLAGDFSQWSDVTPEFLDEPGDTYYANPNASTLRTSNDIVLSKVTKDADSLYFYVKTKDAISKISSSITLWMSLLINNDCNYKTGWNGYKYRISNYGSAMKLYKYNAEAKKWSVLTNVHFRVSGGEMMLAVARASVELTADTDFDFKWVDNISKVTSDILDFISNGECAPNVRFNYRYKGSKLTTDVTKVSSASSGAAGFSVVTSGPEARFSYSVPVRGKVSVGVYSSDGVQVAHFGKEDTPAGSYAKTCKLSEGVYVARYTIAGRTGAKKFSIAAVK